MVASARRRYASSVTGGSGRGYDIIAGAETIDGFLNLRQNLFSLAAAGYFSELIDKLVVGPEKDENIWNLLIGSFRNIDRNQKKTELIVSEFENSISELLGYGKHNNFQSFVNSLTGQKIDSYRLLKEFF
jgi:recombinational DNA repair protein (RecF pathway)